MRRVLKIFFILLLSYLFYIIFFPPILLVSIYGYMYYKDNIKYENSFNRIYKELDYNDSAILFYKKELEKEYSKFIYADNIVDIFKSHVKLDIAESCIEYRLKKHNEKNWIEKGSAFSKNARNRVVNIDKKLIKKLKNINYKLQLGFYTYDFNLISNEIAKITNLCDNKKDIDELYNIFLDRYLEKYIASHIEIETKEKEWLNKLLKTSKNPLYTLYIKNEISLQDIYNKNKFNNSLSSADLIYENNNLFVADSKRGIELWNMEENRTKFIKTLNNKYNKVYHIEKINNLIYATGEKRFKNYFIIYKYNKKSKSLIEISNIEIGNSNVKEWKFYNNNKNIALACGYGGLYILDISDVLNIKIIKKLEKNSSFYNLKDIDIYINRVYFLSDLLYSLDINSLDINSTIPPLKKYSSFCIDKENHILYAVENLFSKGVYLHKYKILNSSKLELLKSKTLKYNLKSINPLMGINVRYMKWYKNRLYLPSKRGLTIYNKDLNIVNTIDIKNLMEFKFLGNKIICATKNSGILIKYLQPLYK